MMKQKIAYMKQLQTDLALAKEGSLDKLLIMELEYRIKKLKRYKHEYYLKHRKIPDVEVK